MSTTTELPALPTAAEFILNFGPEPDGDMAPEGYPEALTRAEAILSPDLDAARVVMRDDEFLDAPGPSIHLNGDIADALLLARGWTVEVKQVKPQPRRRPRVTREQVAYIAPDGERYWHRDEALTVALTAEGLAGMGR